jgi:hypothetical protein
LRHVLPGGIPTHVYVKSYFQKRQHDASSFAIVVTDLAAGTAGMKLVERPEPQAAINDVVVQVHASGFVLAGGRQSSAFVRRDTGA